MSQRRAKRPATRRVPNLRGVAARSKKFAAIRVERNVPRPAFKWKRRCEWLAVGYIPNAGSVVVAGGRHTQPVGRKRNDGHSPAVLEWRQNGLTAQRIPN